MSDVATSLDAWFPWAPTPDPATTILYWLPHSGATAASVAHWARPLGERITLCPVVLPGRGARSREPAYTSLRALITNLASVINLHRGASQWAIGGHSFGALLAWEVTHEIRDRLDADEPRRLLVSGCAAPQKIVLDDPPISQRSDEEIVTFLRDLGGTDETYLMLPPVRAMIVERFRADVALREQWRYRVRSPILSVPIDVFAATHDPRATVFQHKLWHAQTTDEFGDLHVLDGGHFAIYDQASMDVGLIRKALTMW